MGWNTSPWFYPSASFWVAVDCNGYCSAWMSLFSCYLKVWDFASSLQTLLCASGIELEAMYACPQRPHKILHQTQICTICVCQLQNRADLKLRPGKRLKQGQEQEVVAGRQGGKGQTTTQGSISVVRSQTLDLWPIKSLVITDWAWLNQQVGLGCGSKSTGRWN